MKDGDIRRDDLDPSDVLSTFSVGGSIESVMSVCGPVVVGVLDVAVVEVVGVVELVSSFHVSLPKIN